MLSHMNEIRSKTNPNKTSKNDYSNVIKALQTKEENSTCFDCCCKGTTYYVLNFGTFVCSKCAGILRELRFKVKGISVSLFSEEEKNHAEMMGNAKASRVWMGLFNYKTNTIPKEAKQFKSHLKDKYINKRYFKKNKDIKKVRFDSEESDSDDDDYKENDVNNNNDDDDSNEEEYSEDDEEGEDESDEEDDKNEEEDKKDNNKGKQLSKGKDKNKEMANEKDMTPISSIKIKKPHNKLMSESMKFSKKAWEDLWDKADLTKIKPISINEFEFFDKDTNGNSITISNTNNTNSITQISFSNDPNTLHNENANKNAHDKIVTNNNNDFPDFI